MLKQSLNLGSTALEDWVGNAGLLLQKLMAEAIAFLAKLKRSRSTTSVKQKPFSFHMESDRFSIFQQNSIQ